jgi:hypothetical protein
LRPDAQLAQMGRCGRVWVEQEFTADMYRSRLLAAYRDVGATILDQAGRTAGHGAVEHPSNA